MRVGDQHHDGDDQERAECHQGLGTKLTPGEPDHRTTSNLDAVTALGILSLPHVGEHQILHADLLDGPGRVEDRTFGAHEQRALPVGMTFLDNLLACRQSAGVPAGPSEAAM